MGHRAALGVADEVDLGCSSGDEDPVDERGELGGALLGTGARARRTSGRRRPGRN